METLDLHPELLPTLRGVLDPEVGLNIVDLGLVYAAVRDEAANKIRIVMTFTTPHCPAGPFIADEVRTALEERWPGDPVELNVVFEPAWTPALITEAGRAYLGIE